MHHGNPSIHQNSASVCGQKCLCGSCGAQHQRPGTRKEPRPPMHQVIVIQASEPAVDPAGVVNCLQSILAMVQENTVLRQSPMDERAFVEV